MRSGNSAKLVIRKYDSSVRSTYLYKDFIESVCQFTDIDEIMTTILHRMACEDYEDVVFKICTGKPPEFIEELLRRLEIDLPEEDLKNKITDRLKLAENQSLLAIAVAEGDLTTVQDLISYPKIDTNKLFLRATIGSTATMDRLIDKLFRNYHLLRYAAQLHLNDDVIKYIMGIYINHTTSSYAAIMHIVAPVDKYLNQVEFLSNAIASNNPGIISGLLEIPNTNISNQIIGTSITKSNNINTIIYVLETHLWNENLIELGINICKGRECAFICAFLNKLQVTFPEQGLRNTIAKQVLIAAVTAKTEEIKSIDAEIWKKEEENWRKTKDKQKDILSMVALTRPMISKPSRFHHTLYCEDFVTNIEAPIDAYLKLITDTDVIAVIATCLDIAGKSGCYALVDLLIKKITEDAIAKASMDDARGLHRTLPFHQHCIVVDIRELIVAKLNAPLIAAVKANDIEALKVAILHPISLDDCIRELVDITKSPEVIDALISYASTNEISLMKTTTKAITTDNIAWVRGLLKQSNQSIYGFAIHPCPTASLETLTLIINHTAHPNIDYRRYAIALNIHKAETREEKLKFLNAIDAIKEMELLFPAIHNFKALALGIVVGITSYYILHTITYTPKNTYANVACYCAFAIAGTYIADRLSRSNWEDQLLKEGSAQNLHTSSQTITY